MDPATNIPLLPMNPLPPPESHHHHHRPHSPPPEAIHQPPPPHYPSPIPSTTEPYPIIKTRFRNRKHAFICAGIAVLLLVVVPLVVFAVIIVHTRKKAACQDGSGRMINGAYPDGTTVCS